VEFKSWKVLNSRKGEAAGGAMGLPGFLQAVLSARGLREEEEVRRFLDGGGSLYDPFLLKDMDQAAERVRKAIDSFEKILVFGDYDCDGITATVILYDYLENVGADVLYYIPERGEEGYGLNPRALERIRDAGVSLVITVDNGISALEESEYAASLGLDMVITDHHKPGEKLPRACAVVDPWREDCAYPFPHLCGAGVAFKLICALEGDTEGMLLEHYGDILALGTLADVVPLLDENRRIVSAGLECLAETENLGLLALAKAAGLDLSRRDADAVTFGLAPRINAAGRIGSVDHAVELLLCGDEDRARELAEELDTLNARRKELEKGILEEISCMLEGRPELLSQRILCIFGQGWNQGVIGITASRLMERYGKPCVILSQDGGEVRGSARSVDGFSIIDAVRACSGLLTKFGGHPMAAGFSLEPGNVGPLIQALEEYAADAFPSMPVPSLTVDTILRAGEITLNNIQLLERLSPFGCGNPRPVFGLLGVKITEIVPMGNGKHLRLGLEQGGTQFQAVLFGIGPDEFPLERGETADCAVALSVNTYGGAQRPSVRIVSIRPQGFDMASKLRLVAAYQSLRRGEEPLGCGEGEITFARDDLSVVFRWLRGHSPWRKGSDILCYRLGNASNYCKVLAALDILTELGLISRKNEGGTEVIQVLPIQGKANLLASPTYRLFQQKLVN
jgi:single-stranded-DNA-specific exonuclease